MNEVNYNAIDEAVREELFKRFETERTELVCPFIIVQGVDNVTQGVITNNPNAFKSQDFQQLFRGQAPIIPIWKNSLKIRRQEGDTDGTLPRIKDYQVGESYYALISDNSFVQTFEDTDEGNKKFTTSSTLFATINFYLPQEYYYYWYVIPKLGNDTYYYIENFVYLLDKDDNVLGTELELRKVNDQLESTVNDAQLLITPSFSNEAYAWPTITPKPNSIIQDDIGFELRGISSQTGLSNGIKSIQITTSEPALNGSFYAIGRPIKSIEQDGKTYETIEEPRHLLPSNFLPAKQDLITGLNSPSDVFLLATKGHMRLGKEYKNWWTELKANIGNENEQLENYGAIADESNAKTLLSNPDLKSYWDEWEPVVDSVLYKTYSPYAVQEITLSSGLRASDRLALHAFCLSHIVRLPVEFETRVPFSIFNLIVGGFKKLFLGQDGLFQKTSNRTSENDIPFFVDESYYNLIVNGLLSTASQPTNKYLPLMMFSKKRPNTVYGKNQSATTMRIELSDLVDLNGDGSTILTTEKLGKDNTNFINGNSKVLATNQSYLVDRIIFQAESQSLLKVSVFDYGDTYNYASSRAKSLQIQSNSLLTDSFTDWTTVIKTSQLESDDFIDTTPDIPGDIPDSVIIPNEDVLNWNINADKNSGPIETLLEQISSNINIVDLFNNNSGESPLTFEQIKDNYRVKYDYKIEWLSDNSYTFTYPDIDDKFDSYSQNFEEKNYQTNIGIISNPGFSPQKRINYAIERRSDSSSIFWDIGSDRILDYITNFDLIFDTQNELSFFKIQRKLNVLSESSSIIDNNYYFASKEYNVLNPIGLENDRPIIYINDQVVFPSSFDKFLNENLKTTITNFVFLKK